MEDANVVYAIPVDTGSVHYDLAAAGNDANDYDMSAPGERSAARRNKAVAVNTLGTAAASNASAAWKVADANNSYDMSAPGERSAARGKGPPLEKAGVPERQVTKRRQHKSKGGNRNGDSNTSANSGTPPTADSAC